MKFPFRLPVSLIAALASLAVVPSRADDLSIISDVRAYQPLAQKANFFTVTPEVHVAFTLAAAADVTVEVGRHHADDAYWPYGVWPDIYLPEPFHVQTLKLGHLEAGRHDVLWNGLDDKGAAVTETNMMAPGAIAYLVNSKKVPHPTTEQMLVHPPVNLFRFTVKAGSREVGLNFRRAVEGVGAYRQSLIGEITDILPDGQGGYLVANDGSWQAARLTSTFEPISYFPRVVEDNLQNVGGEDVFAAPDGHGHILIGNSHSLFRYNLSDGSNADWPKPTTPFVYANRMRLGKSVDGAMAEDTVKSTPGMAYNFHWAVDAEGNICALRQIFNPGNHPHFTTDGVVTGDIQIFDNDGTFKRNLSLPQDVILGKEENQRNLPFQIAVDKNGDFWVGSIIAYLVDGRTGAIKSQFKNPTRKVIVGGDGSVYGLGLDTTVLYRLHADGTPFPFGAAAPGRANSGESLSWGGDDSPLPPSMRQTPAKTVIGGAKGDFYVLMPPVGRDQSILHFSPDGTFLPEGLPRVDVAVSRPANVFTDHEPAVLDLYINNLGAKDRKLVLDWTLTDFFGKEVSGKSEIDAKALARQSCELNLPATELGFYYFKGTVEGEGIILSATLSRVHAPDLKPAPDSHFAVLWDNNFYLGALAGLKKERVGSDMWSWREPVQGLQIPDVPDSPQSGFTARRNFAARWGMLEAEMSNYGEPWTTGDYVSQIHDLSLYLNDWMKEVDFTGGRNVQHYQFWNELNNFWHVPGPFSLEYYNTVNGDFWDINKARDKETQSIPDGNVGDFRIMSNMGADGTYIYNDAVECHYPMPYRDQQPKFGPEFGVSEMGNMGFPEFGPMELNKLIAIRDQYFPGKPVLDTEEGWYGDRGISMKAGADCVPRLYIPDITAGADEIYWCAMESSPGGQATSMPLSCEAVPECTTQASFCSFATMTHLLEGAEPIGPVDLQKKATQAYLFRKGDGVILPVWAILGKIDVTLPVGVAQVTVVDIMGRSSEVQCPGGSLPLHLTDSVQYVTFPFNAWAKSIAKQELDRQLAALQLDGVDALSQKMETSAPLAAGDLTAMNRYFHLYKAARQAAFTGAWPGHASDSAAVRELRKDILAKEGADGYLRQARLPLQWSEQMVRVAAIQGGELQGSLLDIANEVARSAQALLAQDSVVYPGVAINPFIGDVGEIGKIRAVPFIGPTFPFYESQFRTQIPKKAGESFELELTAWNFYRHPVVGKMEPKLPDGWTAVASNQPASLALDPGKFVRVLYTVTIPAGTKPGIYPVDGETTYNGKTQSGIRPQRVQVQ